MGAQRANLPASSRTGRRVTVVVCVKLSAVGIRHSVSTRSCHSVFRFFFLRAKLLTQREVKLPLVVDGQLDHVAIELVLPGEVLLRPPLRVSDAVVAWVTPATTNTQVKTATRSKSAVVGTSKF